MVLLRIILVDISIREDLKSLTLEQDSMHSNKNIKSYHDRVKNTNYKSL